MGRRTLWASVLIAAAEAAPIAFATEQPREQPSTAFTFTATGAMGVVRNRLIAAAPLPNGKAVVAGGEDMNPWDTAEEYDPATGTFSGAGVGKMTMPREEAVAAPLPNGKVLIVGGFDGRNNLASAELYDPATKTFSSDGVGKMNEG